MIEEDLIPHSLQAINVN